MAVAIFVVAPVVILLIQANMSKVILQIFLWGFGIVIGLVALVWLFSALVPLVVNTVGAVAPYAMVALAILIAASVGFWLGSKRPRTL